MKKKIILILLCINLLIPFNIFAYSAKDGIDLNAKYIAKNIYYASLFEFYPAVKEILYTSNWNFKYKLAKGEYADEDESYHIEDVRSWYDGESTKYLSVILKSSYKGIRNIVLGFKDSNPKVLVDFQDDDYINYFRSSSEIKIYKGSKGYVIKVTRTNSWPAADEYESPIDRRDFYFVDDGNGNISRPSSVSYGEELSSLDEVNENDVVNFQTSGEYFRKIENEINLLNYVKDSYNKESYDRFLQDVSQEEIKEFKDSLLPIFSGYENLDRGLINSNLVVNVADKLFANNDVSNMYDRETFSPKQLKNYGNNEVNYSFNNFTFNFDKETFKKYLKDRYNINAEDKVYSKKINVTNFVCNLEGQRGVYTGEEAILNTVDYLIMGNLSAYYNYAIVKAMNIN